MGALAQQQAATGFTVDGLYHVPHITLIEAGYTVCCERLARSHASSNLPLVL